MKSAASNPTPTSLDKHYDAVIIGGGIQGSGCAQALAARGFNVLLLEKNTLGSGTSSRSSKLIHGGLRYLETAQFSLVRKSLNERALLCKLAPDLVKLKNFYLPIYRSSRVGRLKMAAGLLLYGLLGNFRRDARFSIVPKRDWSTLPGLKQDQLVCVYKYHDAQTDDQLLTRAVANSASDLGATILEGAAFLAATCNPAGAVDVSFNRDGEQQSVSATLLINAAGPWVEQVQGKIDCASKGPDIALVQGTHIEMDAPIGDGIFYVESPVDGRAVFVMPWKGHVMVGTTESVHTGDPGGPRASDAEVDYLQRTLLHYFPAYTGKLINQWAGLRVLPQPEQHAAASKRPFSRQARDTIIYSDNEDKPQVISLYGGKLTAYRVTADDVLKTAMKTLGRGSIDLDTRDVPLG